MDLEPSRETDASLDQCFEIDRICDRFESAWRAGRNPSVEAYVAAAPAPMREALQTELLRVEEELNRSPATDPSLNEASREPTEALKQRRDDSTISSFQADSAAVTTSADDALGARAPLGYQIQGLLGRGGMGVVYKALQTRADRLVALKMIRNDTHIEREQLERFRVEARAVAHLRHPNIVQIYDVGEVAGLPYFSLELLEGGTLKDRLQAAPMPPRAAAALLVVLARALESAHQAGIVHRDLKPANILFGSDGTPKVADFGLAKRLEEQGQTLTGQIVGTPSYMAPEQAEGQNRAVGPLSDVYALGAILYETLTRRPPYQGKSVTETLMLVLHSDPVAPTVHERAVPRDLETICLKCLMFEPSRRYPSAAELADDLERFLVGKPIKARATPFWERAAKWARRRPTVATLSLLGLVGAIALAVAAERYDSQQRARRRDEQQQIERLRSEGLEQLSLARVQFAKGELTDARQTLEVVRARLPDVKSLEPLRRSISNQLRAIQQGLDQEAEVLRNQHRLRDFRALRDEALLADGFSTFFGEDAADVAPAHPRAEELTRRARDGARAALAVFTDRTTEDMSLPASLRPDERAEILADHYLLRLVLAEALARPLRGEDERRQAAEALACLDRAATLHAPTTAYHSQRASYLDHIGNDAEARNERARGTALKTDEAFDHFLLGRESARVGHWNVAEEHLTASLRRQPESFWPRCMLATVLLNNNPPRAAEARSELSTCVGRHPDYSWLFLLRGTANGHLGDALAAAARRADGDAEYASKAQARFQEAEEDFAQALKLGLDENLTYVLHMNRGVARFQRAQPDRAAADFQRAIALRPQRYNAYVSLANVERARGNRSEAIALLTKAIALQPRIAALYRERARVRLKEDGKPSPTDLAPTLSDLEESARLASSAPRSQAGDHALRGQLYLGSGRPEDALNATETALRLAGDLALAHLVRIAALLELERYDDVLAASDAALKVGVNSSELYRLRGLARAGRNEFAEAITDYTQALALRPKAPAEIHRGRGWSYIYANAFDLARRDFEAALQLKTEDVDAMAGRAAALVRLGRTHDARREIERALSQAKSSPRIRYIAAQVYALAAARGADVAARQSRLTSRQSLDDESRAAALLASCLESTPPDRRAAFWHDIVTRDPVLVPLLRNPALVRRLAPREGGNR